MMDDTSLTLVRIFVDSAPLLTDPAPPSLDTELTISVWTTTTLDPEPLFFSSLTLRGDGAARMREAIITRPLPAEPIDPRLGFPDEYMPWQQMRGVATEAAAIRAAIRAFDRNLELVRPIARALAEAT
jgi:hypothetical protein